MIADSISSHPAGVVQRSTLNVQRLIRSPWFAVLTAPLWYLAFHPANLWPLVFVAWAPLLAFIVARKADRVAAWTTFGVIYLASTVGYTWLWNVGVYAVFGIGAFAAGYVWIYVYVQRWAVERYRLPFWIFAPFLLVGTEWIKDWAFGGLPFYSLSHPLIGSELLSQSVDLIGSRGLSLLPAFTNVVIAGYFASVIPSVGSGWRTRGWKPAAAASALLIAIAGYGAVRMGQIETEEGPDLCLIQGNVPQSLKVEQGMSSFLGMWNRYYEPTVHSALMQEEPADLLIWPETMFPALVPEAALGPSIVLPEDPDREQRGLHLVQLYLQDVWKAAQTETLIGMLYQDGLKGDDLYNRIVHFDEKGQILNYYDKAKLVPFGEYFPGQEAFPGISKWVRDQTPMRYIPPLRPGKRFTPFSVKDVLFGATVCYDAAFPGPTRRYAQNGSRFVICLSNEGWYEDGAELDLLADQSRFRAIESRLGMVRATNTGISCFIDPLGRVERILTDGEGRDREIGGILRARVTLGPGGTVYARMGDVLPLLSVILWAGIVLLRGLGAVFGRLRGGESATG